MLHQILQVPKLPFLLNVAHHVLNDHLMVAVSQVNKAQLNEHEFYRLLSELILRYMDTLQ